MQEISLTEAARRLQLQPATVAKLAVEISRSRTVKRSLRSKRLPGRKVGRIWLFLPEHVAAFAKLKRPVGRPAAR